MGLLNGKTARAISQRIVVTGAAVTLSVTFAAASCGQAKAGRACAGHGGVAYYHDNKGLIIAHCNDGSTHDRGVFG
jgi:hypothetical protein